MVNSTSRVLLYIWLALLASPLAWGASLTAMFWLTHPVCQGGLPRLALVVTGVACAVVALLGSVLSAHWLKRAPSRPIEDSGDALVFLMRIGLWGGLIFALVIGLSLVPTALLTPCPL
jgi:hypothetical protein